MLQNWAYSAHKTRYVCGRHIFSLTTIMKRRACTTTIHLSSWATPLIRPCCCLPRHMIEHTRDEFWKFWRLLPSCATAYAAQETIMTLKRIVEKLRANVWHLRGKMIFAARVDPIKAKIVKICRGHVQLPRLFPMEVAQWQRPRLFPIK